MSAARPPPGGNPPASPRPPRAASGPPGRAEPPGCMARRVLPLPCARLPGLSLCGPLHRQPRPGAAARPLLSSLAELRVPPLPPSCLPACLEEGGEGWEAAELGRQNCGGWPGRLQAWAAPQGWVLARRSLSRHCWVPCPSHEAQRARLCRESQSVSAVSWEQCAATGSAPAPKKGQRKTERGVLGAVGRV